MVSLGYLLSKKRQEMKISQKDLSNITGISQTTICSIENDKSKPSPKNLLKLCEALGLNYDEIYDIFY